jgi:signal transduction histidine kinase
VLALVFRKPEVLSESTLRTLEAIGDTEAVAIENARVHRLVDLRAQLAVKLRECGERALAASDDAALQRLLLETAMDITRSDRASLTRIVDGQARAIAGLGKDARLVGHEVDEHDPLLVRAAASHEPLAIEDASEVDATTAVGAAMRSLGTASFIFHALRYHGRPIGHLFAGAGEPRRYAEPEIEAMQILGGMAAEALERQRAQAALRIDHARLDAVIDRLPWAVAVVHRDGRILHQNAAAAELDAFAGTDEQNWKATPARLFYTDGRPIPPEEMMVPQAFAGQSPPPREFLLVSAAGDRKRSIWGVTAPLPSPDGQVHEVLVAGHDVTALRELADAKDRFLRIASHELRSPLTSLRATTSLLELDPSAITDEARRKTLLERVQRQVDRLTRLVEQLLDSTRLHATEVPLIRTECDLVELCREALEEAPVAGGQTVRLDTEGPVIGRWDQVRIEQVVANLVGNALRYSGPGGEIVVRVRSGAHATVEVIDHGIGIPADQLDRVFTPFFRASNAAAASRGGLGLGLHITAEIVRRHGGTIRVASEVGRGSTFTVELPFGDS